MDRTGWYEIELKCPLDDGSTGYVGVISDDTEEAVTLHDAQTVDPEMRRLGLFAGEPVGTVVVPKTGIRRGYHLHRP